jgi:hypothetical protein
MTKAVAGRRKSTPGEFATLSYTGVSTRFCFTTPTLSLFQFMNARVPRRAATSPERLSSLRIHQITMAITSPQPHKNISTNTTSLSNQSHTIINTISKHTPHKQRCLHRRKHKPQHLKQLNNAIAAKTRLE